MMNRLLTAIISLATASFLSGCPIESISDSQLHLKINNIAPADASVKIQPSQVVSIELSDEPDPASVNADNIQLYNAERVALATDISISGNKLLITPRLPLALAASYTLTISAELKGKNSQPLAETRSSSFNTRDGDWSSPLQIATAKGESAQIIWQQNSIGNDGSAILNWENRSTTNNVTTSLLYAAGFDPKAFSWRQPLIIDQTTAANPFQLQAKVLDNGNTIAVWSRTDNQGASQIYTRRYIGKEDRWENSKQLSSSAGNAQAPNLTTDGQGNLLATWNYTPSGSSAAQAYASRYSASTDQWSTPLRLDAEAQAAVACCIAGADNKGNMFASWRVANASLTSAALWIKRYDVLQNTWLAGVQIAPPILQFGVAESLSLNAQGNSIAAWNGSTSLGTYYPFAAIYNPTTQQWSQAQALSNSNIQSGFVNALRDGNGTQQVVWEQEQKLLARVYDPSSAQFLPQSIPATLTNYLDSSGFVQDSSGGAWLLWLTKVSNKFDGSANILRLNKAGGFEPVKVFGAASEFSGVTSLRLNAANGQAIVSWVDSNGRLLSRHFH